MSELTDPFKGMIPSRKLTNEELARAIRLDVIAELDATSLYQAHLEATDNERAKQVLAHIRDEEKEHVVEFMALLKELDPGQAQVAAEEAQLMSEIGLEPLETAMSMPSSSPGKPELTVGSLYGEAQV